LDNWEIGQLPKSEARPLLKWAGGKRQLLPTLREFFPEHFEAYHEPFVGSGAVFFDLCRQHRLDGHTVHLTDSNRDLIACYAAVRDQPEEVIDELARLERDHHRLGSAHYYKIRDQRFNPERLAILKASQPDGYTPALAAMFIYLNRTGYNGLFRLNAGGEFNVPAGRYTRPRICDAPNLRDVSSTLRQPGVILECRQFQDVVKAAKAGDFLYLDPPYAPVSRTANFTNYTASRFGVQQQQELQQAVIALARRGCHVVMSNSTATEITALYARNYEVASAGLQTYKVPARRAINSRAMRRGPVEEYVITNVKVRSRK